MERLIKKLINFWLNQSSQIKLFLRAVLQVTLVALNTYQVANGHYIGAIIVGFLISLVWTFNVKSAAFGSIIDKLIYASGAAIGTGIGLLFSTFLYS
jgi:hypothetical protein